MQTSTVSQTPMDAIQRPGRRRWPWLLGVVLALAGVATAVVRATLEDPLESTPVTGVDEIVLREDAFSPPVIEVERGTTVTWRWADDEHNLVGDGWGVAEPRTDGVFERAFDTPGAYEYQCTLHFRMRGRVDVVPATT
jgi:plastocyanin